jgi:lipoprotein-anchoring transpeptidase ErfK/SrfK
VSATLPTRRPSLRSPLVLVAIGLLILVGAAVLAAYIYDQGHRDHIAKGVRVGGVDVGGLSVDAAKARVIERAVAPHRRTLTVHAGGRSFTLTPAQSRITADLDQALDQALADSQQGWLGSRVINGLTKKRVDERIPLKLHYAAGVVPKLVDEVSAAVRREPIDAKADPSAAGLKVSSSHDGRALDAAALKKALASALLFRSHSANITATTNAVAPKLTTQKLAAKYPAYIIVDRSDHVLRFYQHLQLSKTYPIAVGMQGLETPVGLYDVQWKQTNPSWYVPNSPWAGKLAGKVIPPGPDDPIKARWMAFNGGAGIHGIDPSEYGSIGHDASHGCVRMRIPDVISLYAHTPVGTPVYVA